MVWGRHVGDMWETCGRHVGDMGETWGRHGGRLQFVASENLQVLITPSFKRNYLIPC